jgi:hypothetical protein
MLQTTNSPEIDQLCQRFLDSDHDALGWASLYPDESNWESPDCDVMSERFLSMARASGLGGFLVRAESLDEGVHWFVVISGDDPRPDVAVDWTAKQFWNAGFPAPATDPSLIPCPLVFEWPGHYPLDIVEFQTISRLVAPMGST